jgi:NAD+ synthase (glutamine-hydrolysing)
MRTLILMDKANMTDGIVIGTGDLSEIALGWCTYNGDHMSMFGVNSGVPKTVVRKVCEWYARRDGRPRVAKAILDIAATPVSPELKKGQVTEDSIGPYELHDFFLWNFIVNEMGPKALAAAAEKFFAGRFDAATIAKTEETFFSRFFSQVFKRNCSPDGVRVFTFDLSPRGWWIPSDLGRVKLHG